MLDRINRYLAKPWLKALMVLAAVLLMPSDSHAASAPTYGPELLLPVLFFIGPVTPSTLVELNDLAKDYYSDVYLPMMNTEVPLKNQFGKLENATFTGRKWIFGVKMGVGGGASNAGANRTLPAADEGKYDQGEATLVRTYVRMALDGLAIEVTKRRDGSYRPALAETMADRLQAHDLEINRQLFSNGDGRCASLASFGASATQVVGNDYGVVNGGNGARHLYEGDTVALRDNANALIGRRVITAIDTITGNVTLDSTITSTATTNYLAKSTSDDDNFSAGELNGLLRICQNTGGTFEAIPTSGRWRAQRFGNNGTLRPITDSLVMTMIAKIRAESRQTPNLVVTRPGVVLRYSEIFLPLRRLDGQDVQLKGGYKPLTAITHAGGAIPVMDDNDCPNSRMFFLTTASMRMADLIGTEWFDLDGAQFTRIDDKDGIEGFIRSYRQLITVQRNANGVIEDLEDIPEIDRIAA